MNAVRPDWDAEAAAMVDLFRAGGERDDAINLLAAKFRFAEAFGEAVVIDRAVDLMRPPSQPSLAQDVVGVALVFGVILVSAAIAAWWVGVLA